MFTAAIRVTDYIGTYLNVSEHDSIARGISYPRFDNTRVKTALLCSTE